MINSFAISCVLIIFTTLPLGLFVYFRNKNQPANKLWFLYSLAIAMWGIFGTFIAITENPDNALIYWRITMGLGVIWMPVLFYHFAYLYSPWNERGRLILAYIITAILAISAFTPYYIPGVKLVFNSFFWSVPGIAFYVLTVWWFMLTGYSHTKLYISSRKMPRERQNQIKFFIIASSIGYLGGLLDFGITYGLNLYPWGNFLVVIYPFIMAYAIAKHGLFDIFVVVKRTFFSAIAVGLTSWAILSLGSLNALLVSQFNFHAWMIPVLAGIVALYLGYLYSQTARQAENAKQEFITVAAHKLRTPITHIRYIANGLKESIHEPASTVALVDNLTQSGDLLLSMVNKLLEITNLEKQSERYEFVPIDLANLTADTVRRNSLFTKEKNIILSVKISPNLPLAEGYHDGVQFAIQALIENAIMYAPNGGRIDVNIDTNKKDLIWSIRDNGIGLSRDDLANVFDKFFRGESAMRKDTEGTGLALFMSRNLINRQGGDIHVESAGLGHGSHFWFTLPISTKHK